MAQAPYDHSLPTRAQILEARAAQEKAEAKLRSTWRHRLRHDAALQRTLAIWIVGLLAAYWLGLAIDNGTMTVIPSDDPFRGGPEGGTIYAHVALPALFAAVRLWRSEPRERS